MVELSLRDRPIRTLLFVPASDERKLQKVARFGSDAVVIDLEDAVAEDQKSSARGICAAAVGTLGSDTITMVRVNGRASGRLDDDIDLVTRPGLDAIVLPKVEDASELERVDAAFTRR